MRIRSGVHTPRQRDSKYLNLTPDRKEVSLTDMNHYKDKQIEQFNDWLARWKDERKTIDAVAISNLWHQPIPRG